VEEKILAVEISYIKWRY